jgi:hypothetical protein
MPLETQLGLMRFALKHSRPMPTASFPERLKAAD